MSKKKKKTGVIVAVTFCIIVAVLLIGYFVLLPNLKYKEATDLMTNKKYDAAYAAFIELNDYKNSKEQAKKCCDSEAKIIDELIKQKKYKNAKAELDSLSSIEGGEIDKEKKKLVKALVKKRAFKTLFELIKPEPKDSLYFDTLNSAEKKVIKAYAKAVIKYAKLKYDSNNNFVASADEQINQLGKVNINNAYTTNLKKLKTIVKQISDNEGTTEAYCNNIPKIFEMYKFKPALKYLQSDMAIGYALIGYWVADDDDDKTLRFSINSDKNIRCVHQLPAKDVPGATAYDIKDKKYILYDKDNNAIGKNFKFDLESPEIMDVYCYSNDKTYHMTKTKTIADRWSPFNIVTSQYYYGKHGTLNEFKDDGTMFTVTSGIGGSTVLLLSHQIDEINKRLSLPEELTEKMKITTYSPQTEVYDDLGIAVVWQYVYSGGVDGDQFAAVYKYLN